VSLADRSYFQRVLETKRFIARVLSTGPLNGEPADEPLGFKHSLKITAVGKAHGIAWRARAAKNEAIGFDQAKIKIIRRKLRSWKGVPRQRAGLWLRPRNGN